MNPLMIKDLAVGSGKPKICVSIIASTHIEILEQAKAYSILPIDMMEWRVDSFEDFSSPNAVMAVLEDLNNEISRIPLLFTLRSKAEGGSATIDENVYEKINHLAASSGLVDLLDLEFLIGEKIIKPLIKTAHQYQTYVIVSNHDYSKTPDQSEMLSRMMEMQDLGADLIKLAVMPDSKQDVINLMEVTLTFVNQYGKVPAVTMSMGELGKISRVSGSLTGSVITFGSGMGQSAPGQIPVTQLSEILELL